MATTTAEIARPGNPTPPHRSPRATIGLACLLVLTLVAAGVTGWLARGEHTKTVTVSTVSEQEAQTRYLALSTVVGPACPGIGDRATTLDCKTALVLMAAMLRGGTWPSAAAAPAQGLAAQIDAYVAFLDRLDAATPEQQAQIVAEATGANTLPWPATYHAAATMRQALGLRGSGSSLL